MIIILDFVERFFLKLISEILHCSGNVGNIKKKFMKMKCNRKKCFKKLLWKQSYQLYHHCINITKTKLYDLDSL